MSAAIRQERSEKTSIPKKTATEKVTVCLKSLIQFVHPLYLDLSHICAYMWIESEETYDVSIDDVFKLPSDARETGEVSRRTA